MISAASIFLQANIRPDSFGEQIVPPTVRDREEQKALAIAHIETEILPSALTEVEVPLMAYIPEGQLPLDANWFVGHKLNYTEQQRALANSRLQTLFEDAVKSYARAEINRQVASNSKSYDEDSDTNRKEADAKLKKLLDALALLAKGGDQDGDGVPEEDGGPNGGGKGRIRPGTGPVAVPTSYVF